MLVLYCVLLPYKDWPRCRSTFTPEEKVSTAAERKLMSHVGGYPPSDRFCLVSPVTTCVTCAFFASGAGFGCLGYKLMGRTGVI